MDERGETGQWEITLKKLWTSSIYTQNILVSVVGILVAADR